MSRYLEALQAVEALASLVVNTSRHLSEVSALIHQATAEGRDLSAGELEKIRGARREAMDRLREL